MSARPGNWQLLDHSKDPVGGDPARIAELTAYYATMADTINSEAAILRKIGEGDTSQLKSSPPMPFVSAVAPSPVPSPRRPAGIPPSGQPCGRTSLSWKRRGGSQRKPSRMLSRPRAPGLRLPLSPIRAPTVRKTLPL